MIKRTRAQPTIVQVSADETLVAFPTRPGVTFGRSCDLPFEKYKHLLSDRPTRPPYRGPERARRTGTQRRKPSR